MPKQKSQHVDDPVAVGRRLRDAREAAGLSQRDLSFSGCSAAYISRIEAGTRIPSLQLLREMGRRLGVSEDYLATGVATPPAAVEEQRLIDAQVALRLAEVDAARELFAQALADAVTPAERGDALAGLGQLAFADGDLAEATRLLEEGLALQPAATAERWSQIDTLGRAHLAAGRPEEAVALYERALAAAGERREQAEQVRFAVALASALIDAGAFGRAEEALVRVAPLTHDSPDPLAQARRYWSQSRAHASQGDTIASTRYARRALAVVEAGDQLAYGARVHHLLACVALERGDGEAALELLRKAGDLLRDESQALVRNRIRIEQARALATLGRGDEAEAVALDAAGRFADLDPVEAGRGYLLVAGLRAAAGDRPRAIELYELAAEPLSRTPNRFLIEAYGRLADLFEAEGRKDEALEVLKKAVQAQAAGKHVA